LNNSVCSQNYVDFIYEIHQIIEPSADPGPSGFDDPLGRGIRN